jgi:hypothetical protein
MYDKAAGCGPFLPERSRRSCQLATPSTPFQPAGVPDSRPVTEVDAARIRAALAGVRTAQQALENAVAQAVKDGGSVRAVAELGMSANTVQKYGRSHGWPTDDNRERFYESPLRPRRAGGPRGLPAGVGRPHQPRFQDR